MIAYIQHILFSIGLLVSLLTLGSLLGQWHWVLDVLSHYHLHYTVLLLLTILNLLVLGGSRRRGLILLPALLVNLYLVGPFFIADDTVTAQNTSEQLRVLSMNISTSNEGYPQVIALIQNREPDIVYLSEVRPDLVSLMNSELGEDYPVQYAEPSRWTLGVAILARDPAVNVQTVAIETGRWRRYLRADFDWRGMPVTLVGSHPLPPMRGNWAESRNHELALLTTLAQETAHPFILAGDLNAFPWSVPLRNLSTTTNLRYASDEYGYGIWPTWFLGPGFVGPLLGAPLDHILVSPDWQVVGYTEAGDIRSDHAPVQADLMLRTN